MRRSLDKLIEIRKALRDKRLEEESCTRKRSKTFGGKPSVEEDRRSNQDKLRRMVEFQEFYDD